MIMLRISVGDGTVAVAVAACACISLFSLFFDLYWQGQGNTCDTIKLQSEIESIHEIIVMAMAGTK